MSLIKYPYTNLHEINLDWLIEEVKKCYSPENPPDMAVLSVNGMTGDVTLYTDPAAVFPEIDGTTWSLGRTAAGTMVGIKYNKNLPLQRINGTSLFNIYDAGNPPPYPVTSVNGRTGAVSVQEAFFSLTGDTITFITDSPDHSWSIDRATVDGSISLRLDTTNDTPSAYLEYVSDDETISRTIKLLTPDDIPSSSGVVSVNGKAGVVTLTGDDITQEEGSAVTVASALNTLGDDVENITNKIGNTAMGTQATTITGAVKEHSTAISSANSNISTINTKLGNVGNTSVQDQIDTLNSNLTHRRQPGTYTDSINYGCYGYITSNGERASVCIPLVWDIDVQNATITKFLARIRSVQGTYLGGANNTDITEYITNAIISKAQGLLIIVFDKTGGWGITNNTPIIGECTMSYTVSDT